MPDGPDVRPSASATAAAAQHQPGDQHQATQADHGVNPIGVWRPEQSRHRGCHRSQTSRSTTNKAPNTRKGVSSVSKDCVSIVPVAASGSSGGLF